MFAVIQSGGKQYKVAKDDVIRVEKLAAAVGETVALDRVLMIGDGQEMNIGTPHLDGACVMATVLDQARADKIIVFKKNRRKGYRRTKGHRQRLTVLQVAEILAKGHEAAPAKAAKPAAAPAAEEDAAKAAATPARKAPAKKAATEAPAKKTPAKGKGKKD